MKIKLSLALLMTLSALAWVAAPSVAQAQETKAYGTGVGAEFKAFEVPTAVVSEGTTPFVLEEAKGEQIECQSLADEGTMENREGVGHSELTLHFDSCALKKGPLAGCPVSTAGAGAAEIVGTVDDEVIKETEVEITVTGGFALETEPPCPSIALGKVTGKAVGHVAKGSNELKFAKATGLFLGEEPATITGTDATTEEETGAAVLIN